MIWYFEDGGSLSWKQPKCVVLTVALTAPVAVGMTRGQGSSSCSQLAENRDVLHALQQPCAHFVLNTFLFKIMLNDCTFLLKEMKLVGSEMKLAIEMKLLLSK